MNKIHKILIAVSRSFSVPIFGFLISLLGIRFYGKESWGEFIYSFTWILLLAFIASFGNKDYLIRKYSKEPSKIAYNFSNNITSRMLLLSLSLIVFVIFPIHIAIASFILIIAIFIYQSLDSLIIYNQLFLKQLIAEALSFIIIIGYFSRKYSFNLETIIYIYTFAYIVKISILFLGLKQYFRLKSASISISELKQSSLFFLIVFSGFIASKIDLYMVNLTMSKAHISEYQLGITAFLLLQSLAYLIILPFNKHVYRLKSKTLKKIKKVLAYVAIPIVFIGTISIWLILEKIAHLDLSMKFYFFGGLSSLPIFFYILDVQELYKNHNERVIIKISFIAIFVNVLISYLLISKYGILGGILSVFIMQMVVLFLYKRE